uniref:Uncharacterized protein n=1 Tax=Romanomermis culicivorax TaxID=13658 RepID=A0A915KFE8_ROMCU
MKHIMMESLLSLILAMCLVFWSTCSSMRTGKRLLDLRGSYDQYDLIDRGQSHQQIQSPTHSRSSYPRPRKAQRRRKKGFDTLHGDALGFGVGLFDEKSESELTI